MRKTLIGAALWTVIATGNLVWYPHKGPHFADEWGITIGCCLIAMMGWGEYIRERRKLKGGADVPPPPQHVPPPESAPSS